ncbi:MAG: DNA (cytosine-5-)-methyltransferase [Anaerovoracaceae bacterium]
MNKQTIGKELRVFEAFAGIGAQSSALSKTNIKYKIVGISDWFIDAIECYAAMHCSRIDVDVPESLEEIKEYLNQFTFSADSVRPYDINRLSDDKLRDLYRANKRCNNFGSVTELKGCDMPKTDLLVYSFPCQDLSTGGLGKGMKKGSGTRSGLLWEIERILSELKDIDSLPEYLLLENVRTIKADSNISDLNQWLSFLESIGYQNDDCMLLNALDFGVPQDRKRVFIVSHLGSKLNIQEKIDSQNQPRNFNIRSFIKDDYDTNPTHRMEADVAQLNKTPSRDVMWDINGKEINDKTIIRTITCNMDRTHTAALFKYSGIKGDTYRRLTLREAFLLMGFTEDDYAAAAGLGYSYRKLNKLIGNSIVVNVLKAIFVCMFEEKYRKAKEK